MSRAWNTQQLLWKTQDYFERNLRESKYGWVSCLRMKWMEWVLVDFCLQLRQQQPLYMYIIHIYILYVCVCVYVYIYIHTYYILYILSIYAPKLTSRRIPFISCWHIVWDMLQCLICCLLRLRPSLLVVATGVVVVVRSGSGSSISISLSIKLRSISISSGDDDDFPAFSLLRWPPRNILPSPCLGVSKAQLAQCHTIFAESSRDVKSKKRWGFKYFYFHPYSGKISNFTNIFQSGWNHQLEEDENHLSRIYDICK